MHILFINRPFLSIHKTDFSLSFSHFEYFARCFYVSLTDFVSVETLDFIGVQLRSNWRQITKIGIFWAWGPIIDEQSLVRMWICQWALGQLWSHCKILSSWFCVCIQKCLLKMYPQLTFVTLTSRNQFSLNSLCRYDSCQSPREAVIWFKTNFWTSELSTVRVDCVYRILRTFIR